MGSFSSADELEISEEHRDFFHLGYFVTSSTPCKRVAIPLGLIFTGVSAIGGLIMKGVNTWSNYKKSKAMTKAVEKLYEAQEIDHCRLTGLEGQTSLLARTMKTAFQHIDYRLLKIELYCTAND